MARALPMSETGIRLDERKRMHDILNSPEAKAHPALAQECIIAGLSVTQAVGFLRAAGKPAASAYTEALDSLAIGISGPASNALNAADPQEARRAEIRALGASVAEARGYRRSDAR